MGLNGTLADLGVVDLIQFPYTGRQTGELVVTADDEEARLYYDKGALVHATLGDASGMNALVRVVGWSNGTFEFFKDTQPSDKTIDIDLHRALMQALKLHDELKKSEEMLKGGQFDIAAENKDAIAQRLSEYVASTVFALHACVLTPDGKAFASADGQGGPPMGIEKVRSAIHAFMGSYPRRNLSRIFLEDDEGTILTHMLSSGGTLIIMAAKEASLGAVSMSVGRFVAKLEQDLTGNGRE